MKPTAVVVGSGPNGLAAAIVLAQAGLTVEVREARATPGGAASSAEITLPGFVHDLGSAVHPLGVGSPFFSSLDLGAHGLKWIWSPAELAHPLDGGSAVLLYRDIARTAAQFGADAVSWNRIFTPLANNWKALVNEVFQPPIHIPRHPLLLARFGWRAVQPATDFCVASFRNPAARAIFAGTAAHSGLKLTALLSSAFGLVLCTAAHAVGWPIPQGGSQKITEALKSVLLSLGGRLVTDARVSDLKELDGFDLKMCDISPRELASLGRNSLPGSYLRALEKFQYGPGSFKVDWALSGPIPWQAKECAQAITVHLGGSLEELTASEQNPWDGNAPHNPFILLAQPSLFDGTRAPAGQHTAWAYCHVPNGWSGSALTQIEDQIERFAPGFRSRVLARAIHNAPQMQAWNQNLVGGDVNGGAFTPKQFVFRPTWREYSTPLPGLYLCSASTPPGGAVHGLCGYYAARIALGRLRR